MQHNEDRRYRGTRMMRAKPSKIKAQYSHQPVRTAHTFVHHHRDSFLNISIPPGQHDISDVAT